MKLLVNVNQKESVRAGHDAPHSTHLYDLNPTDLPADLRQWLPDHWDPATGRVSATVLRNRSSYGESPIIILPATTDSLVTALRYLKTGSDASAARDRQRQLELEAAIADYRERWKANPKGMTELVRGGSRITLADAPYIGGIDNHDQPQKEAILTADLWPVYDAVAAELRSENEDRLRREAAERATKEAATMAAKEASRASLKAQRDAHAAALGLTLGERWAAGLAAEKEIDDSIGKEERRRLFKETGFSFEFTGDTTAWDRDDGDEWKGPISDAAFDTFKEWKSYLPEGATITLYDLHNHAKDEYDHADLDTKIDRLLVAEAEWQVGEVTVQADRQIGELPDETGDEE